jgi:hypothetical protein
VVDVNDRPLIRQFSRWSNCHPLRQAHRRSAEKAKPFGFFFRLAHRRGEGFWSVASHKSNAPRKRSFPYEGKVARSAG